LRCGGCGLVHASPRPTPEELDATYAQSYFDDRGWLDPTTDSGYLQRCWNEVKPYLGPKGRLLDVGCATGAFVAAAANAGWDAWGLEYSEAAATRAVQAGLQVRAGSLDDQPFRGQTFDVITAWHVVEHLIDPVGDLLHMRALAGQGATLVIETPNARSVGAKLKGAEWAQIRPPEHINFFDRHALTSLLERTGWHVTRTRTIYRRDTAARIAGKSWLAPAAKVAARLSETVGMGGNLRVIARTA
jgi:2-polyprenyl-3-methyl-5-hydroxy-6-metoxy-1,4-benzoquinol methylase